MANQKGYVILKGKADDLVPETENIYASPTLKSIIRRGKRNVEIAGKAMAVTDVKEAYRLAKEQIEAAKKKTAKKINPLSGIWGNIMIMFCFVNSWEERAYE